MTTVQLQAKVIIKICSLLISKKQIEKDKTIGKSVYEWEKLQEWMSNQQLYSLYNYMIFVKFSEHWLINIE